MTTLDEPLTHSDAIPNADANGHVVAPAKSWTLADSAKLYGIQQWGGGYFNINAEGHVAVNPTQDPKVSIDLKKLIDELRRARYRAANPAAFYRYSQASGGQAAFGFCQCDSRSRLSR